LAQDFELKGLEKARKSPGLPQFKSKAPIYKRLPSLLESWSPETILDLYQPGSGTYITNLTSFYLPLTNLFAFPQFAAP
jgi:hypothetical protein